jgi:hypothetical protein
MAMIAYLEAVYPQTAWTRKDEIRGQLLDTYALVRLWQYFANRKIFASGNLWLNQHVACQFRPIAGHEFTPAFMCRGTTEPFWRGLKNSQPNAELSAGTNVRNRE